MRVLVTGATGFVGSQVVPTLIARGHQVVAAVRDGAQAAKVEEAWPGVEAVVAPLEAPDALAAAARSADGVVHLAFDHAMQRQPGLSVTEALGGAVAKERAVIAALVEALAGSGRPLVATSACGILGDTGPVSVDEDHPSPPNFPPAMRRVVEDDLVAAAARGVRTSVIRVPLMTHGGAGGGVLGRMTETARQAGFGGYIGEGANRLSSVNLADLADLYVLALENAPAGAVYNGAGGDIATRDLAVAIAKGAGDLPVKSVTPEAALAMWGPFAGMLLGIDNRCSNARARAELGWRPYETVASLADDLAG